MDAVVMFALLEAFCPGSVGHARIVDSLAKAVVLFFPDTPEYKRLEQHPVDFGLCPFRGFPFMAFDQFFSFQFFSPMLTVAWLTPIILASLF
ncbi:hypothetical protein [Endozoicomonas acroporae]|uniref:hypothetical protein n=1 Tax=Endozoicomonas acroporae TaxID=1701104 RepID=UPI0015E146C3|nr:hypothetical protein [Endozoicomonas acroporae]